MALRAVGGGAATSAEDFTVTNNLYATSISGVGSQFNVVHFGGYLADASQVSLGNLHVRVRNSGAFSWSSTENSAQDPDTGISRSAAGVVEINNGSAGGPGAVLLNELASDASAPAADKAVLYARDNGSGKTQLVVRFASGAVQVLATEP